MVLLDHRLVGRGHCWKKVLEQKLDLSHRRLQRRSQGPETNYCRYSTQFHRVSSFLLHSLINPPILSISHVIQTSSSTSGVQCSFIVIGRRLTGLIDATRMQSPRIDVTDSSC